MAERNTAPNNWADNLFIGIAYYFMGEKDRGILRVMSNVDRGQEKEISGKAADLGHTEAQYSLGVMYYNGYGVKQDYAEAVKWFRIAATRGHTDAQEALKQLGERP